MKKSLDVALLILFFVGLASNFMSATAHEAARNRKYWYRLSKFTTHMTALMFMST